jgi:hypothetical protein
MEIEFLASLNIKTAGFWIVMPCRLVYVYDLLRFRSLTLFLRNSPNHLLPTKLHMSQDRGMQSKDISNVATAGINFVKSVKE